MEMLPTGAAQARLFRRVWRLDFTDPGFVLVRQGNVIDTTSACRAFFIPFCTQSLLTDL